VGVDIFGQAGSRSPANQWPPGDGRSIPWKTHRRCCGIDVHGERRTNASAAVAPAPGLLFAGMALDKKEYLDLWKSLGAGPAVEEILRNFPVRQPMLWV
jgi:hypothetical protein